MIPLATQHLTTLDSKPVGSLPRRYAPRFARLMREIRRTDAGLADAIREQLVISQLAERKARRLLARYRISQRKTSILRFPAYRRCA